jgi:hypothetical protein
VRSFTFADSMQTKVRQSSAAIWDRRAVLFGHGFQTIAEARRWW